MPDNHAVIDPAGNVVVIVHAALILLEHTILIEDEQSALTVGIVIVVGVAFFTGYVHLGVFRIGAVSGKQLSGRIRYTNCAGDDISVAVEIVEGVSDFIPTSSVHNAILIIRCTLIAGEPTVKLQDAVAVKRIVSLWEQSICF